MNIIPRSELIINEDGSVYHLKCRPGDVSATIITVGDPERVHTVSSRFDAIETVRQNREFLTHTGTYKGKRMTVISTGIGTDNVDIVMNEIDALFNIDLERRILKKDLTRLKFIRIGTSGTLRPEIAIDSLLVSLAAVGLDGLMHFYRHETPALWRGFYDALLDRWKSSDIPVKPYLASCSEELRERFGGDFIEGITFTANGFYAPQGRSIRTSPRHDFLNDIIIPFEHDGAVFTNMEMETAGIYGLADALGHDALSFNAILANRTTGEFSPDPERTINRLISKVLDGLVADQS